MQFFRKWTVSCTRNDVRDARESQTKDMLLLIFYCIWENLLDTLYPVIYLILHLPCQMVIIIVVVVLVVFSF